jgi:hypothetical protein
VNNNMWKKFLIVGLVALVAVPAGVFAAGFQGGQGSDSTTGTGTPADVQGPGQQNAFGAANGTCQYQNCEQHGLLAGRGGNAAANGSQVRTNSGNGQMLRTRSCDGTCDQTRNQTRLRDGSGRNRTSA